jgi:glycine cleavage system aminomethyltransferase T
MSLRTSLIVTEVPPNGIRDACVIAATYSTVEAEYDCIRSRVGLQDLSHYGKIMVSGDAALDLINHLIMTDLARLPINQVQSSYMLDEQGRPICEMLIANLGTKYLLLTEGAAPDIVEAKLRAFADQFPGVTIANQSDDISLLSLDGPWAWELLKTFLGLGVIGTRYLEVVPGQVIAGVEVTLCRAGKTGEYGYLLIGDANEAMPLWSRLIEAGGRFGLLPVGYEAVDLCKMENRNISQHHEGAAVGNVLELNTRTMLARDKEDHVGRAALQTVIEQGVQRRLVGITLPEELPATQTDIVAGASVSAGGKSIGALVNAGYSFSLKRWIGLALLDEPYACAGVAYGVRTAGGAYPAKTVSAPFLFNKSLTIRPQEDSYFA